MNIYGKDIKVDRKMGKILLESNVIQEKENIWLKELLLSNKEPVIKNSQIEELDPEKQSFFNSNLFNRLYKAASKEWVIVDCVEDEEKKECTLCGQKDTTKKYYIRNKINNKEMNVGSTCVDKIDDIRSIDGKTKEEIEKEYMLRKKEQILNNLHNGLVEKIDNLNKEFEKIPTVVEEKYENKYNSYVKDIQDLYEKYRKKAKVDKKIIEDIYILTLECDKIIEKIYQDIENKKDNEWYINENIAKWCYYENKDKNLVKFLKEDGIIIQRSACRIYERNFINKIIGKLQKIFIDSDIIIIDYDERDKKIIFNIDKTNIYNNRIELKCSYNIFLQEYVDKVFADEKIKRISSEERKFLIKNSTISENSVNIAMRNLKYILEKNNIVVETWDNNYNELVIRKSVNSNLLQILSLKEFILKNKNEVFENKLDELKVKEIKKYIQNNSREVKEEEYNNMITERIKKEEKLKNSYNFV